MQRLFKLTVRLCLAFGILAILASPFDNGMVLVVIREALFTRYESAGQFSAAPSDPSRRGFVRDDSVAWLRWRAELPLARPLVARLDSIRAIPDVVARSEALAL